MARLHRKRRGLAALLDPQKWGVLYKFAWIGIVALFVVVIVWVFLPRIHRLGELQEQAEKTRGEIQQSERGIEELKLKQIRLKSDPQFVEEIAREELGWAKPGEHVLKVVPRNAEQDTTQP